MERFQEYSNEIIPRLSPGAKVVGKEVKKTWLKLEKGLKCFAQTGGHSWRVKNHKTIDVVICMRGLNKVFVDEPNQTVTFGGGIIVGELINAVAGKGFDVTTGLANTVGVVGAAIYGGLGRYVGRYSHGADNLVAVNLVDSDGTIHRNVNGTTNPELWWAIRGAGAAFGIITKATMKIYPQTNDGLWWTCTLIFSNPSRETIEKVFKVINSTHYGDSMFVIFSFSFVPPMGYPSLVVALSFYGQESRAEEAWERVLDPSLRPDFKQTAILPAERLNDCYDVACVTGYRRPGLAMGIERLEITAFFEIWDLWLEFGQSEDAKNSAVIMERFSKEKTLETSDEETAFSRFHRGIVYEVNVAPTYKDAKLDQKANEFTRKVRDLLIQKCSDPGKIRAYPTGSGQNEPLENIFNGKERIEKLLSIKKKWDPENYWGAFFDTE
ncbi:hypothetical protein TWF679_007897 [Orbilia oligospora]|uniref:FAD-binding PCMH-type domain-containing protein n=1 Tax=Orbilia oligospora TaxID=2813651 RepID=A0A8H8V622_ORBOL|nr:hypothetical protein TWF679_007897 [Orbilia oligospora]